MTNWGDVKRLPERGTASRFTSFKRGKIVQLATARGQSTQLATAGVATKEVVSVYK